MTALDLLILAAIAAASLAGYRLGLVARSISWVGLALGIVVAGAFVDDVAGAMVGATPRVRFFAAVIFVLLAGSLGQAAGVVAGTALRRRLPSGDRVHQGERVAGAALGATGVLVIVWLLIPAFASAPGWPARAVRESVVVSAVDRVAPDAPPSALALGRFVGEVGPEVFSDLVEPPDVGPPPSEVLPNLVARRVAASVVQVEGEACDRIQNGSGYVTSVGTVVTNAHVVAGEDTSAVETFDGQRFEGRVVAFDPDRDLAVLDVPGLDAAELTRADAGSGTVGAVYGYPRGGPLQETPARVAERIIAVGTDIYRTGATRRDVFVLAAELQPGDSGGPLVDREGQVIGVAFAVDPEQAGTGYALTNVEVDAVLSGVGTESVDTGPCLVG
ncbi:MAG: MarP family serine protease [Acidimicrobiia bacterium]